MALSRNTAFLKKSSPSSSLFGKGSHQMFTDAGVRERGPASEGRPLFIAARIATFLTSVNGGLSKISKDLKLFPMQ